MDKINEFVPLKDKIVTKKEFENWLHLENVDDLSELILQLINSQYSLDVLRKNIKSYSATKVNSYNEYSFKWKK